MSLWNELRSLGEESIVKLNDIYMKRNFPVEVRNLFADWFEEQNWNFDEQNVENGLRAEELFLTLTKKMDEHCSKSPGDLISQMRTLETRKQFDDAFGTNAKLFVATVREILNEERELVAVKQMEDVTITSPQSMVDNIGQPIFNDLRQALIDLRGNVTTLDTFIKEYRNRQEDFIIQYQDVCKVDAELNQFGQRPANPQQQQQMAMLQKRKEDIESDLRTKAEQLLSDRSFIMKTLLSIQQTSQHLSYKIVEDIFSWRAMQQKSLSGAPKPGSLDEIQEAFESISECLWHFYSLATQYKLLFDMLPITKFGQEKEQIQKLLKDIVQTLTTLILRSFIVDKQPPQVLKTQTKFQASVRLLIGSRLNLQMSTEVTVSILSEKQCKDLAEGKKLEEIGTCGEILNEKCVMELNKDRSCLQAEFKNLQLKKIKRQDRKGQESVLEAKSALVFSAKLNISGDEMPVMCMSVPVVVVVHGNQGPNSEATIIWDNMFSKPDRAPFEVPEEVSWKEMSIALNARWIMTSEYELHQEHRMYLREKIFSNIADKAVITADSKIPWAFFNKEPLKGKSFTFWEWFHGAIDVVKKHLKEHGKDQCLEFMSRQTAHKKLLEKPPGTFLIRFSDGELGAVTIAWCCEKLGRKEIWYLQPWSSKDFGIRGLADRIFDIPDLTHLYPDIPKEEAFGRFRSLEVSSDTDPAGYVSAGIIAKILPQHDYMSNQLASRHQWPASPDSAQQMTHYMTSDIEQMNPTINTHELNFSDSDLGPILPDGVNEHQNAYDLFRYFPIDNN